MKIQIYLIYILSIFIVFKTGCSSLESSKTPSASRNKWKKARTIYSNQKNNKSIFKALILGTNAYFNLNQPKYIFNQLTRWNTSFNLPHFNKWLQKEVAGSKHRNSSETPADLAAARKWSLFFKTAEGRLFKSFYYGNKRSNGNKNEKIIELFEKYLNSGTQNPLPFFIFQKFHAMNQPLQLDRKQSKLLVENTASTLPLEILTWLYNKLKSKFAKNQFLNHLKNKLSGDPAAFQFYFNQVKSESVKNLLKLALQHQYPLPTFNSKRIIDYKLLKYMHYLGINPAKTIHDKLKNRAEHLRLQGKIKKAIALLNQKKPDSTFSARIEAALLAIHFHDFKAADRHLRWAQANSKKNTDRYTRLRMLTGELAGEAVFSEIKLLYQENPELIASILRNKLNFHLLQLLSTKKNKREFQKITRVFTNCLSPSSAFFKYWSEYTELDYDNCTKGNARPECPDFSKTEKCILPPLPELEFSNNIAENTLPFLLKQKLSKIYKNKVEKPNNKPVKSEPDYSLLDLPELLRSEKFSRNKFVKILEKLDSVYWKREVSEFVFNYFNYLHKNSNRGKLAAVEGAIMANDQLRAEYYFNTTLYKSNNPDKLLQQGIQIFLHYGLRRVAARLMLKYLERKKSGFGLVDKADSKFLAKVELDYLIFLYQAGFWTKMKERISYLLRHYSAKAWDFEVLKFKIAEQFQPATGWNKKLSQFSSLQYKTIITLNQGSVAQSRQILKLLNYIFPARFDINALLCLLDSGSCQHAVKLYKLTSGVYELSELSITRLLQGNWQTSKSKLKLLEFHLFLYALGQTYKINNQDLAILARTTPF